MYLCMKMRLECNVLLLWIQFNKALRVSLALSIYMLSTVSSGIRPKASLSPSVPIFSYVGERELKYPLLSTA